MYYLPPINVVRDKLSPVKVNGKSKLNCSYEEFAEVLKLFLRGAAFDEKWYVNEYPDVAEAVAGGIYKSGRHHFIEVGYFEGRRPQGLEINEEWYLQTYPDVAESIKKGTIPSALLHFVRHGYTEGRQPSGF